VRSASAGPSAAGSIGLDALSRVVVELVRDATRHWGAVLIVNGHGGNGAALQDAVSLLAGEGRHCLAWSASWPHGDAHAGRTETSPMLALDPASVRLDLAVAGDTRPLDELMPVLRERGLRVVTANGVLGDPTGATAEEGGRILDALADGCAAALDALLDELGGNGAGA
jgi:creatinine amidohydrolase